MYVENWLEVGESGDSGVAGGRNCVVFVQFLVACAVVIGVKCQWARVTAAGTRGRGELSIGVDVSRALLLSLSVKYACDGLDVRGCVVSIVWS